MFIEDEYLHFDQFFHLYRRLIDEFSVFNQAYEMNDKMNVTDYRERFNDWKKSIQPEFPFDFHIQWLFPEKMLTQNQLLLDCIFGSCYFFEMKYDFSNQTNNSQDSSNKSFKEFAHYNLNIFRDILGEFVIFNVRLPISLDSSTVNYQKIFEQWKKEISRKYPGFSVDIQWLMKDKKIISSNAVKLTVIYEDEFIAQLIYQFSIGKKNPVNIELTSSLLEKQINIHRIKYVKQTAVSETHLNPGDNAIPLMLKRIRYLNQLFWREKINPESF